MPGPKAIGIVTLGAGIRSHYIAERPKLEQQAKKALVGRSAHLLGKLAIVGRRRGVA
jgi:hypothetical protein